MNVDPHSARFIDWAFEKLEDDAYYNEAVDEIKQRLDNFYSQSKDQLLTDLKAKMIKGAQEHGEPNYPVTTAQTEINNEYIDLLGWMLIERWIQKNESNSVSESNS